MINKASLGIDIELSKIEYSLSHFKNKVLSFIIEKKSGIWNAIQKIWYIPL